MNLVLDANVAVGACFRRGGFERFGTEALAGPPLMWSESRSTLHLGMWRGEISSEDAEAALARLEDAPVERVHHPQLGPEAWRVADELGWARTYDAEYVALARLLGGRLITLDQRLRRGVDRLDIAIGPDEI